MPMKIVPTKKKKKSKKGGGGMDIGRPAKTKEIPMSRTMSLIKKEPAIKGYVRGGSVKKASGAIKKARMVIPMQPEKAKEKKKTTKKKSSGASPFIMPGQKKMLDRMTGKSKPQTLKGGGIMGLGAGMKAGRKADMQANKKMPDPKPRKNPRGLKAVPEGNKGKGLSKLPTEVRNKMGYMIKGGKVMKMRGGGAATRGLMFNNR